jgi:hypothetical protein
MNRELGLDALQYDEDIQSISDVRRKSKTPKEGETFTNYLIRKFKEQPTVQFGTKVLPKIISKARSIL